MKINVCIYGIAKLPTLTYFHKKLPIGGDMVVELLTTEYRVPN